MPVQPLPNRYPPRSRIECVGPGCGIIVTSATASRENWAKIVKRQYVKRGGSDFIGWCPRCRVKFEVER